MQYGPQALAAMVHLNQHHMVPVARTAQLMSDFFGLQVSEAVVLKACAQAKERLEPTVDAIAQALQHAPIVHADEMGLRAGHINPRASATGKRGRIKQSKAANLIARLRQYADDVWRFATDPGVPFTNNIAEQAVRMPKVGQKISGGFRTLEGAKIFCVIRSYLATMHKQGAHLLDALTEAFRGTVPQPWGVGA